MKRTPPATIASVAAALRAAGITDPIATEAEAAAAIRALAARSAPIGDALREIGAEHADPAAELRRLDAERRRLEPLAAVGTRYRERVITAALAEGVRALGRTFDHARWAARFADAHKYSAADIEEMGASWKAAGDAYFKGGRQTLEVTADPPKLSAQERAARAAGSAPYRAG